MRLPFGSPVTRRRFAPSADLDRYGNPVMVATETELPELAAFDPGGTAESIEADRGAVTTSPSLYFAEPPDLAPSDEVQARGEWFTVEGAPLIYVSPFDGVTGGVVVRLKRVDG